MTRASAKKSAKSAAKAPMKPRKPLKPDADGVVRLSGGNPQVAKGHGEAVVQAFIKAMPGWTRGVGADIDRVISRVVPKAAKAVKWNSPMYGFGDGTWFLSFHVYARYVKVSFFRGAEMTPPPPVASAIDWIACSRVQRFACKPVSTTKRTARVSSSTSRPKSEYGSA